MTASPRYTASATVEAVYREEYGLVLASLVRQFRDLDLAEDATAEALATAVARWPRDGVPERPGAWLLTTARRRAVDRIRRDRTLSATLAVLHAESDRPQVESTTIDGIPDERLQLFFTCAHPALGPDDRIALTLRCLAGLTTDEVGRALLIGSTTAGQRISRAKRRIRVARIPFRVPEPHEVDERLPGVLQVLYSVFTEGYASTAGPDLVRHDLSDEAIRLARVLHTLMPGEREVAGLLALMVLTHARRATRSSELGETVLLEDQDRSRWDADLIAEGLPLVRTALSGGPPGAYGVQAAVAALHVEAPGVAETDWSQIVALYGLLARLRPSSVVALARAGAIAMRDGPRAGLDAVDAIADDAVRRFHPFHAVRADLLDRLGCHADAATEFRIALDLAGNAPDRALLRRRLDTALAAGDAGPGDARSAG